MADAYTLPSDLYVPEALQRYIGYEFYKSLGVFEKLTSQGPLGLNAPVKLVNFDVLRDGGHYVHQPVVSPVTSLVSRRDIANGGSAVDTLKFASRDDIGVACRARIGPVAVAPDVKIAGTSVEALAQEFARQGSRQTAEYIQNAVILAWKAAVDNMTATAHTLSVWAAASRTNLSTGLLMRGFQKMSDRMGDVSGVLMRSESAYDLFLEQDGKGVSFEPASTGSIKTLGRAYAIVDDATLTTTDAGFDKYHTLWAAASGIELEINGLTVFTEEQRLDTESVHNIMRADVDFTVRIPGMKWDTANGGANPTIDTSGIGLSTNWDVSYTDAREVKLGLITHNYSGN
jgi:hypothetical protein